MKYTIGMILAFFVTNVSATEIVEYDWLTMGEKSGSQKVIYEGNHLSIDFEFVDRGRGPKLHDEILVSKKGLILEQSIIGNTYMGAEVKETFELKNYIAIWENTLENETKK